MGTPMLSQLVGPIGGIDARYGQSVVCAVDYEWANDKAAAHVVKRGIDFLDAIGALTDPHRLEHIDEGFAYGEERIRTVGMTPGKIPFVVTTIRAEDLCRIISARRATRHEQDRYYADKDCAG